MTRAEFSERPAPATVRIRDSVAKISLTDNVTEGVDQEGERIWYADVYFMSTPATPDIQTRVAEHPEIWLEVAKAADQREADEAEAAAAKLTDGEIAEILIDQEMRIMALEMGGDIGDL